MHYKKISVFLDLTDMDTMLVSYASFLADLLRVEKVFFVHVFESSQLPEEISRLFPQLDVPLDKLIGDELNELVEREFHCPACQYETVVYKDDSTQELLEWAQAQDMDLMVLGKKPAIKGSGVLARKIAKLSYSSVLLLPEGAQPQVNKILAPVDFSKFSRIAYRQAKHIAELRQASLICQHVYKLPTQYFPFVAATDKKLKESTESQVHKELERFIKKVDPQDSTTHCQAIIDEKGDVARTLYDYALENSIDLIVLGPKGSSHGEYFLMGSVTEKLMYYDSKIKLLIAKDKKEHESLLSEIFGD